MQGSSRDIDEGFMRLALRQAKSALEQGLIPVGATFVFGGKVIAYGAKSGLPNVHTLFDHAEHNGCYQVLWAREGPRNLEGFTVYSTLEPCLMCLSMLMTTRVSRIVFACDDPYGGGARILQNPACLPARFQEKRPLIEGGLLREESMALLREFFVSQTETGSTNWSNPDNVLVRYVMS